MKEVYVNVSAKGQITIPKWVRDLTGIKPNRILKLKVNKKNKRVVLEDVPDLVDMAGFLSDKIKTHKQVDVDKALDFMEENYGEWAVKNGII